MAALDGGWRRIVSELGIEFLRRRGARALPPGRPGRRGQRVKLDPDFLLEQVAKAPREFDLQARNPERSVHIGGDHMVFSPVYGCPFIRDGLERRDATLADFQNLVRLAQAFPQLDSVGRDDLRAERRAARLAPPRHGLHLLTLSDKPFMGSVTSGPNAADTIAMAELVFGARVDRADARA